MNYELGDRVLEPNANLKDNVFDWLVNGRVGSSSRAMASAVTGTGTETAHPYDPDDLNRCLLFLAAVPEAREHMDKIAGLSPTWAALVERWDELEALFLSEVGLNWCNADRAPETYKLMQSILIYKGNEKGLGQS